MFNKRKLLPNNNIILGNFEEMKLLGEIHACGEDQRGSK
jgi:hypothetical protein